MKCVSYPLKKLDIIVWSHELNSRKNFGGQRSLGLRTETELSGCGSEVRPFPLASEPRPLSLVSPPECCGHTAWACTTGSSSLSLPLAVAPPSSAVFQNDLSQTTAAYETAGSLLPEENHCQCLCSLVCPGFLSCPDFSLGCPVAQRTFSLFSPKGLSARASVFLTVLAPCLEWPSNTTLFSWGNPICPTLTFIWFQFNKHLWSLPMHCAGDTQHIKRGFFYFYLRS